MRRSNMVSVVLALLVAGASSASAQQKSLEETLDGLLPGIGAEKIPDRRDSQQQWQKICFELGAPGNEAARAEACKLMAGKLGGDTPNPARIFLLKQLQFIGRGECVDAVAALLDDKDRSVRDAARRALAANTEPAAGAKLVAKLQSTNDNKLKVGLLNALGYRAEAAGVPAAVKELGNKDQAVAAAAARALGKIATADSAKALAAARGKAKGELRFRICDAWLLCADKLLEEGKTAEAVAIYKQLSRPEEAKNIRLAAQQGLLNAAGKK